MIKPAIGLNSRLNQAVRSNILGKEFEIRALDTRLYNLDVHMYLQVNF